MESDRAQADRVVGVVTGSRLHFGLYAFGRSSGRQYGGVGLMVEEPSLRLRIEPAAEFHSNGPLAKRILAAADVWRKHAGEASLPQCVLSVIESPPQHIGCGSGTQLGCAVAAGLSAWHGQPIGTAEELALASGRAARSAVGTHGFLRGGMIVDDGKTAGEPVGRLDRRLEFPSDWRVLLLWPRDPQDTATMSGSKEAAAFRQMPSVPPAREAELRAIARDELLPAVETADFERFGEAVYRYNRLAGECYRSYQGSVYASGRVEQLIAALRELGAAGAGQSSWGPLVFAVAAGEQQARAWREQILRSVEADAFDCRITSARNRPARIVDTLREV